MGQVYSALDEEEQEAGLSMQVRLLINICLALLIAYLAITLVVRKAINRAGRARMRSARLPSGSTRQGQGRMAWDAASGRWLVDALGADGCTPDRCQLPDFATKWCAATCASATQKPAGA